MGARGGRRPASVLGQVVPRQARRDMRVRRYRIRAGVDVGKMQEDPDDQKMRPTRDRNSTAFSRTKYFSLSAPWRVCETITNDDSRMCTNAASTIARTDNTHNSAGLRAARALESCPDPNGNNQNTASLAAHKTSSRTPSSHPRHGASAIDKRRSLTNHGRPCQREQSSQPRDSPLEFSKRPS
jgi:hypothetical protein